MWSSAVSIAAVALFLYFRDDVAARPVARGVRFEERSRPAEALERDIEGLRQELRRLEQQVRKARR